MPRRRTKKPLGIVDWAIMLLVVAGLGVLAYPFVSDAYASYRNQQVIDSYQAQETKKNAKALQAEYRAYQKKNQALLKADQPPGLSQFNNAVNTEGTANTDAKRDQKKLTTETIARLTIPRIGVSLPIFERTTDWLLQFGVCLLDGTSYPTGGKGTHAVLSGHRGVPNATLFTRLPELKSGDKFFIKIGGRTLAYQVFKRQVIEPTDITKLKPVAGQDLVTLMTCTPYMVNSQRLLITGRRVPYHAADAQVSRWVALWNKLKLVVWALAGLVLLALLGRMGRNLMIARTLYQLDIPAVATAVVVARGRHQRHLAADDAGVYSAQLPGGRYRVAITTARGVETYRAYVKHRRDRRFTLKRRRHE